MHGPAIRKLLAFSYLAFVGVVLVNGWIVPRRVHVPTAEAKQRGGDVVLFDAVMRRLQSGESYYSAMGTELHARNYPTASPLNWRTPLHLSLLATLSKPAAHILLLAIVVAAIALFMRAAPSPIPVLIVVGVPLVGLVAAAMFSEAWAGALIALSLGAYRQKRWAAAALCGILAVFFRELAAFYALGAALLTVHSQRRREFLVWILGGVAYVAYYWWHVQAVSAVMPADALAHTKSWVQWSGLRFVYRTAEWYGWAKIAPALLAPVVVAAGLLGAVATGMPAHARLALVAYVAAFSIIGLPFNSYWGLITVPIWGLGVLHATSGVQRLAEYAELPAMDRAIASTELHA